MPLGGESDAVRSELASMVEPGVAVPATVAPPVTAAPSIESTADPRAILARVEIAAGSERAQGTANRAEFTGVVGFRLAAAVELHKHLFIRAGAHLMAPFGNDDEDSPTNAASAFDVALGAEARFPLARVVELFGGADGLWGRAKVDTQLETSGFGFGVRAGVTFGRRGLGLSIYGTYMKVFAEDGGFGFVGVFGALSWGFQI